MLPAMQAHELLIPKETEIPANARALLSNTGSLTQHLRQITQNTIQHRLLSANWGKPNAIEQHTLGQMANERTWIRRIEWRHHHTLWVDASVIFPESTLKATGNTFPGLGIQPLGEVIFKDPSVTRDPFTFMALDPESAFYHTHIDSTETLWARQSIVHFQGHPMLITEIFLPAAYAHSNN